MRYMEAELPRLRLVGLAVISMLADTACHQRAHPVDITYKPSRKSHPLCYDLTFLKLK